MSVTAPPKLRTLQIEIKLPRDDEHHFLQLHSTSTVGTLKSKIFRKAVCLEGEKPENYVLALKQHSKDSKASVLADDKVIGSHPWIEGDLKNNIFTVYVMPKNEKHETLRRKNSFTRLNMHDDTSRFLMPLPSTRFLTSKPLTTNGNDDNKGKIAEEEGGGKKSSNSNSRVFPTAKIGRSRSEPIIRSRSLSSISELTSEQDFSHSSDIDESMDEEEDPELFTSARDNTAHDDSATSPKPKPRERSATLDKGIPHKKPAVVSGGAVVSPVAKEPVPTIVTEKPPARTKKTGLFPLSLFPRREGDEKESKHRKHASMILPRTDSNGTFPNDTMPANKGRSASFEADTIPALLQKNSNTGIHPVSVDYSSKKSNNRLIVEEDGGKLVVTAGTVEQLIWCLADRDIPDPAYIDEFFYSMNHFTKGPELLSHLQNRYGYKPPEDSTPDVIADYDKWRPVIQERVLKMIRYLIENHWYHIERDEGLLTKMKEFVESSVVKPTRVAKTLRELINSRVDTLMRRAGRSPTSSTPPLPSHSHSNSSTSLTSSTSAAGTSNDKSSPEGTGSTDLATHGRSSSSPIIVWRARRDTITAENSPAAGAAQNNTSPTAPHLSTPPIFEDNVPSTPTSLSVPSGPSNFVPPPKPLGKRVKDHRKVSFIRVHPMEMARQMTLIEKELFRAIRPPELVGGAFKKKNKAEISANVVQMIDWFNHITAWVQKEIVLTPNLKERITVLSLFIQVASHLRELGNLSGAMQIVCALDTTSVKRLYRTWKGLAKKDAAAFVALQDSFTSKLNFANYRRIAHERESSSGAVIPYIGVVLQDLLLVDELPTTLTNGMVNFRKMRRFASLMRSEIVERQALLPRFNFEPVPAIQEYLARRSPLTEQELFRYSRLSEPSKIVT